MRYHKDHCFPYPAPFHLLRSGRRDSFEKALNSQGTWLSHLTPLFYPTTCFQTSFECHLYINQRELSWVLLKTRGRITWSCFQLRNEDNSQETYALGKVREQARLLTCVLWLLPCWSLSCTALGGEMPCLTGFCLAEDCSERGCH